MTGRPARHVAHAVLPLHLTAMRHLHFQPCVVRKREICYRFVFGSGGFSLVHAHKLHFRHKLTLFWPLKGTDDSLKRFHRDSAVKNDIKMWKYSASFDQGFHRQKAVLLETQLVPSVKNIQKQKLHSWIPFCGNIFWLWASEFLIE